MESSADEGDDIVSMVYGDLGLGEAISSRHKAELNHQGSLYGSSIGSKSSLGFHPGNDFHDYLSTQDLTISSYTAMSDMLDSPRKSSHSGTFTNGINTATSHNSNDHTQEGDHESFPTYADVPYGTSLRQQKKLFEQEVENLRRQHIVLLASETDQDEVTNQKKTKGSSKKRSSRLSGKEISGKLNEAMAEMEELKLELDACQSRLDAKYQAVAILKEQADYADAELKNTERRANETSKRLEQLGEGQNTSALVEACDSSTGGKPFGRISQHLLEMRLHRVCQENAVLMSKLEVRNEELRRANAHKAAISRERDELLALVDVAERLKYEHGKSKIAEDEYGSFTSTELAVLGACKCRGSKPEPCGCAHAAANLRKEVAKLRDEGDWLQQRWEECSLTVDAYRSAFEEQLNKSRKLSHRLSQIATMSSRSVKARAAIKWLIQVMNDEEDYPPRDQDDERGGSLSNMSLQELVTVLTDMISEKNEALAHQKLASQVLADKLERLEKKQAATQLHTLPPPAVSGESKVKTSEVGVQSPSMVRSSKSQQDVNSINPASEMYLYDEVFDLENNDKGDLTFDSLSGASIQCNKREEEVVPVVVESEEAGGNPANDLCDHRVDGAVEGYEDDLSDDHSLSADSNGGLGNRTDSEKWESAKEVISSGSSIEQIPVDLQQNEDSEKEIGKTCDG